MSRFVSPKPKDSFKYDIKQRKAGQLHIKEAKTNNFLPYLRVLSMHP